MVEQGKKNEFNAKRGRPPSGIGKSIEDEIVHKITGYKRLFEGWGAKTILAELNHKEKIDESRLPSMSTVKRILKAEGLIKAYVKRRPLSNTKCPKEIITAHQCWQIDDKGAELFPGIGHVILLDVKDVKSKLYVVSQATTIEHCRCHLTTEDYRKALRSGFEKYGKPLCIQSDHGNIFYENNSKSPFPTSFHLWLLGLNITLCWSRSYRPTDQGTVERSHRTIHEQMRRAVEYKDIEEFEKVLQERVYMLNNCIPCDTLGKSPLEAFPEAIHSNRRFDRETEKEDFSIDAIKLYLKDGEWFRKVALNKTVSLGGIVYTINKAKPRSQIRITFNIEQSTLVFHEDKELLAELPIKGITYDEVTALKNT